MTALNNTEKIEIEQLIQTNHMILASQAKKFAKNNPSHIADYNDYYQEACMILIDVWRKFDPERGSWDNYLTKSLINELSKISAKINSSLSVNSNAVQLCVKIFSLEAKGCPKIQILNQLGISGQRYNEVKSILTREILTDSSPNDKNKAKDLIAEIKSSLSGEDLIIFNLCLEDATIMKIGRVLSYSPETARRRLHTLFNKIRKMYNE